MGATSLSSETCKTTSEVYTAHARDTIMLNRSVLLLENSLSTVLWDHLYNATFSNSVCFYIKQYSCKNCSSKTNSALVLFLF